MKNIKIWIGNNPELSEKVQKKLFELDCQWGSGKKTIRHLNEPTLVINSDGSRIMYSSDLRNKSEFLEDSRNEICPYELINEPKKVEYEIY